MHPVSFITTEDDGTYLVVSFAIQDRSDPEVVESLTLQRVPKYGSLKDEEERGVTVSFIDRFPEDDDMGTGCRRSAIRRARRSSRRRGAAIASTCAGSIRRRSPTCARSSAR